MRVELKNVFRFVFYAIFTLVVFACGFLIARPELVGVKTHLIAWAYRDIFMPVPFAEVENWLKWQAMHRAWGELGHNPTFEVMEIISDGEQMFDVVYRMKDENGEWIEGVEKVFVRWKPWAYDAYGETLTEDGVKELLRE
jgi:hypothetical protein